MLVRIRNTGRSAGGILFFLLLVPVFLFIFIWVRGSSAEAVWPEYTGEDVVSDGNLMVDCSHATDGYVIASAVYPTSNRLKMRVVYNGAQLTYDLDNTGLFETFPLQFGSGFYEFYLYENVGGTKYSSEGRVTLDVALENENGAFLVPNQYVNYTKESPSVLQSDQIAGTSPEEKIYQDVCDYMAGEFQYDFVRAQTISPGELPEVDGCFENKTGICQDLSAVMVSMLRVQGIPSKLVIGYADGYYHAWTMSIVNGEEKFFDPTAAINALNASDYQVERYY